MSVGGVGSAVLGEDGAGPGEAARRQGRRLFRCGLLFQRFGEDSLDPAHINQVDLQGAPAGRV